MSKKAEIEYIATGRRKTAVARVRLFAGSGNINVNGRKFDEYFKTTDLQLLVTAPFKTVAAEGEDPMKYDVEALLDGGGIAGQAGALRHGISRALLLASPDYRPILKKAGFLTRDPRMKERKKYGLKAARRAPQFSKR